VDIPKDDTVESDNQEAALNQLISNYRRGYLTKEEFLSRRNNLYADALRGLEKKRERDHITGEEYQSALTAAMRTFGYSPVRLAKRPDDMDVPFFGSLMYTWVSIPPMFLKAENRLGREFAFELRDSRGKPETLTACFESVSEGLYESAKPCDNYRGYGKIAGYDQAEITVTILREDPRNVLIFQKMYIDCADPRWRSYSAWCHRIEEEAAPYEEAWLAEHVSGGPVGRDREGKEEA